ncbi:hypothetical protein EUTSA_v10000480mg, partial [Eutrema salsugineum]
EAVHFNKITALLKKFSYGLSSDHFDPVLIAQKVCVGVYKGLAARIAVSNLYKNTKKSFSETVKDMYNHVNERSGLETPLIGDDVFEIIMKNTARLDSEIIYDRDFEYDYFEFKTLERSYLLKVQGKVVERPQHMLMRVVVGIHKDDVDSTIKTYYMMSKRWFTHASPNLFTRNSKASCKLLFMHQLSSCFLICMKDDSIEGIYETLKECAVISKSAGGIGVSVHNICATGSYIRGTNGMSNDIVPMLCVFNDTARYVDQGRGKRKGVFDVYLEPWHADIFEFLELRKNHGKRVHNNRQWSLFCPNEALGLADCWGAEFEKLYTKYEREVTASVTINHNKIIDVNYYPVETVKTSNIRHRPIGIGVQGLADAFILLGMPFDSPKDIFEIIYYHALKASSQLAARDGSYETYKGSPV